ncbi:YczE/YyaS/YitT family protein [Pseudalkalibacillus berkeleyi]|uniref:YitT family protein n=1 Tax=Pseudalkalibacillus berkeleyi TaxID=1069813 RepID=A0ABS9H5Y5_9BACL|nr:YitT family protein [Pseudalkalibacillus berkeleyi]MCF6139205.1 YitT family protein [Pseudalkalibacillus berkeleyi]
MKLRVQIPFFIIGLILFSYGIAVAIQVQHLGIHPWDVLNIALFEKYGFTIGTWAVLVGLFLVVISYFLDKRYINIGTFLNALSVGPLVDLFLYMNWTPHPSSLTSSIFVLILGVVVMGVGGGMYSAARIGAGPRDGFMLSISDKLGTSISRVRIVVESLVLVLGWVLGGPVFIFTFIYTFIQSPIFQYAYHLTTKWVEILSAPLKTKEKVS